MAIRFGVSSTVKNRLPRYSNFWDGTAVYSPFSPTGSYDALATYTVGAGGISSITFAGLPTGGQYSHLQIRGIAFTDDTGGSGLGNIRLSAFFNGDTTTSNYYNHTLSGDGSSASAYPDNNAKFAGNGVRNSMIAPGSNIIDILDYAATSKYKTIRTLSGVQNNDTSTSNQLIRLISGLWMNTSAINSIQIVPELGNFKQYTQFALYGIRG